MTFKYFIKFIRSHDDWRARVCRHEKSVCRTAGGISLTNLIDKYRGKYSSIISHSCRHEWYSNFKLFLGRICCCRVHSVHESNWGEENYEKLMKLYFVWAVSRGCFRRKSIINLTIWFITMISIFVRTMYHGESIKRNRPVLLWNSIRK